MTFLPSRGAVFSAPTRKARFRRPMVNVLAATVLAIAPGISLAASAHVTEPDTQAVYNRMAAEPLRYAGLSSHQNNRILLGLHQTANGGLEGEMMRLDSAMHPIVTGHVTGHISTPDMTQTSRCTLSVALPHRTLTLDGPCSATQMSGALTNRPHPTQLWSQVSRFISPDTSISQYWLTNAAWQAATTPTSTP